MSALGGQKQAYRATAPRESAASETAARIQTYFAAAPHFRAHYIPVFSSLLSSNTIDTPRGAQREQLDQYPLEDSKPHASFFSDPPTACQWRGKYVVLSVNATLHTRCPTKDNMSVLKLGPTPSWGLRALVCMWVLS